MLFAGLAAVVRCGIVRPVLLAETLQRPFSPCSCTLALSEEGSEHRGCSAAVGRPLSDERVTPGRNIRMTDRLDVRCNLEKLLGQTLPAWGFAGPDIIEGVIALVDGLKSFKEEGRAFRPDVYIVRGEDVGALERIDAGQQREARAQTFVVGSAVDEPNSYLTVLKTCVPLAVGEWNVVIRLEAHQQLSFGLLRRPNSLVDETPEERLRRHRGEVPPFLLIRSLADDVVQLIGRSGEPLEMHFWGRPKRDIILDQQALLERLSQDIPWTAKKERVKRLLSNSLRDASTAGHGYLVAVQAYPYPREGGAPDECPECIQEMTTAPQSIEKLGDDGIFFATALPLALRVADFVRGINRHGPTVPRSTIDSYVQLRAWQDLITQCLASDGVVLFDSCARLLGYRIFVRPSHQEQAAEQRAGARKRAFNYLQTLVSEGELVACFYQSQDGATEFTE